MIKQTERKDKKSGEYQKHIDSFSLCLWLLSLFCRHQHHTLSVSDYATASKSKILHDEKTSPCLPSKSLSSRPSLQSTRYTVQISASEKTDLREYLSESPFPHSVGRKQRRTPHPSQDLPTYRSGSGSIRKTRATIFSTTSLTLSMYFCSASAEAGAAGTGA